MALNAWVLATKIGKFVKGFWIPLFDNGNSGTAKTIDWENGNNQKVTLTGNVTFTFANPQDGIRVVLVIHTGAGGFTATWPASVLWSGGTAPVITPTAAYTDIVSFVYDATAGKYYGAFSQNYAG